MKTYKGNISFTYVDEEDLENESPGSCVINTNLFKHFFKLCFTECELLYSEPSGNSFEIEFKTSKDYTLLMLQIQVFRFKVQGKLAKVADILLF